MTNLKGKTLFITGASRGIGFAIAKKAAEDGANVAIIAKTTVPHPKLPGTIYTAAEELKEAGGNAIAIKTDIREEDQVAKAVEETANEFGGIDILVNNASAIFLSRTTDTPMKRFDLMNSVNMRGTFLCSKYCIPHLEKSENPHILNLSPPLSLDPKWFKDNVAYTISKFGMSMCALGMSEELRSKNIAVNTLWPRTAIATAALQAISDKLDTNYCRKPEIVADAAYHIFLRNSRENTGNFYIDDEVLASENITDFSQYAVKPGNPLLADFFLEDNDNALSNEPLIELSRKVI